LYRGDLSRLFQIVPAAGTFGKDYGPDLARFLAAAKVAAIIVLASSRLSPRIAFPDSRYPDDGTGLE